MAVSVRMDPLLEKELELAARRQGITKSQFIVDAVERALGRKNPYELLMALKVEEQSAAYKAVGEAFQGEEKPYATARSRAAIVKKLKAKHGGRAG
ncbi:MAG TPA: hypothetical protein VLG41_02930 [Hydrogenophaga sp.]|uniref:hypothetical protein n=1 Tax=Hydrogenophaga sp. TaxID=1904254 RepID=UPI002CE85DD0|nr:hypothetical protein [Hydrogenophaga sp.]HSX91847.1 hypothetical protein [Hydrogenophaga sp.]